jgi:hypothetical protein
MACSPLFSFFEFHSPKDKSNLATSQLLAMTLPFLAYLSKDHQNAVLEKSWVAMNSEWY